MPFQVISAFIVFAAILIIINLIIRSRGRNYKKEFNQYLADEQKANFAPKKPIGEELFFMPSLHKYPIRQDIAPAKEPKLMGVQDMVIHKAGLKMLHFNPPKTNRELKMAFGYANLENVTMYEEHYNQFMRALLDWAEALRDAGQTADMERVLLNAVEDGCDLSKAYTMLADLYYDQGDRKALQNLYDSLEKRQLPAQKTVWSYIKNKLAGL